MSTFYIAFDVYNDSNDEPDITSLEVVNKANLKDYCYYIELNIPERPIKPAKCLAKLTAK